MAQNTRNEDAFGVNFGNKARAKSVGSEDFLKLKNTCITDAFRNRKSIQFYLRSTMGCFEIRARRSLVLENFGNASVALLVAKKRGSS